MVRDEPSSEGHSELRVAVLSQDKVLQLAEELKCNTVFPHVS
jgi:hypothetical protein